VPETKRLCLKERNALLTRAGIARKQTVTQRVQLSFVERLKTGCLRFHRDGGQMRLHLMTYQKVEECLNQLRGLSAGADLPARKAI
jgi:hypothetical protein